MARYNTIFDAIKNNDLQGVEEFIEKGTDANINDCAYATPLHHAVNRGFVDIVSYLLSKGADKRASDMFGLTPMKIAETYNHLSILALFSTPAAARFQAPAPEIPREPVPAAVLPAAVLPAAQSSPRKKASKKSAGSQDAPAKSARRKPASAEASPKKPPAVPKKASSGKSPARARSKS